MDYQNHLECHKHMQPILGLHCSLATWISIRQDRKGGKKRLWEECGTTIPGGQSQKHVARTKDWDQAALLGSGQLKETRALPTVVRRTEDGKAAHARTYSTLKVPSSCHYFFSLQSTAS